MSSPPTGTVTFLFTDIEGSTKLAQTHPAEWPALQARHHAILRAAIESHSGYIFQIIGDAFCCAFATAGDGLKAALTAQRALHAEIWGETSIRVRMGLHTGAATLRPSGDYEGYLTLATTQRVMSIAYGGQTLMSNAIAGLLAGQLPDGVSLRDMGEQRLKSLLNREPLWQVVAPDLPAGFPPLQSLNAIPNNLPLQLSSFIGRAEVIAETRRLLAQTRLLTLTGSGGVGKTRLSLVVAAEVLEQFPDGVWFVELAPLADPALVVRTVASLFAVHEDRARPLLEDLADALRAKHLLIVLDNCEHVIEACARFAEASLRAAPQLKILASSREPLGITGESVYRVPSLPVPGRDQQLPASELDRYDAVRLFCERARAVQSDFVLTDANAPAVARICQRLDGIPLAIELAAARVRSLDPDQIDARLDRQFALLTGGSRTALPRHQTLQALIAWSYALLNERERRLCARLSVFAGSWTLEAAEAICSGADVAAPDVLELLDQLVNKSLVGSTGLQPRFRFLESIRQFARAHLEQSGELPAVRDRHLDYFVRWVEQVEPRLYGAEQAAAFDLLEVEHDNLRAALEWSMESPAVAAGLRLGIALEWFWYNRGHVAEGRLRLNALLALAQSPELMPLRARALGLAGHLAWGQGDYVTANTVLTEALSVSSAVKDEAASAWALRYLGYVAFSQGGAETARPLIEQSVSISTLLNDSRGLSEGLAFLGDMSLGQGDYEHALALYRHNLELLKQTGNRMVKGYLYRRMGQVALRQGDYAQALKLCGEGIALHRAVGNERGVLACLTLVAATCHAEAEFLKAAQLLGFVDAQLQRSKTQLLEFDRREFDTTLAAVSHQLDAVSFEGAWAAGRALTMELAIALAMEEYLAVNVTAVPHALNQDDALILEYIVQDIESLHVTLGFSREVNPIRAFSHGRVCAAGLQLSGRARRSHMPGAAAQCARAIRA